VPAVAELVTFEPNAGVVDCVLPAPNKVPAEDCVVAPKEGAFKNSKLVKALNTIKWVFTTRTKHDFKLAMSAINHFLLNKRKK
jgi:hypothetical protein